MAKGLDVTGKVTMQMVGGWVCEWVGGSSTVASTLPYSIHLFVNVALFVCLHSSCFIKSPSAVTRPLGPFPRGRAGSLASGQVASVVGLPPLFSPQAARGILYSLSHQRRSMRNHR